MSLFKEKVNLGVNDLWALAYKDYKPYEDRLRSTNVREFKRDTILDRKPDTFAKTVSVPQENFILDKKLGS
jgi:hypothetical protein